MNDIHADETPDDPLALVAQWVPGAHDEPMTMTLGTRGRDGFPAARTVILSDFDGATFSFHTDARSEKVAELRADRRVSLTLLWPERPRQLVVAGVAAATGADAAARAFARRSLALRRLAWLNTAEYARLSQAERRAAWDAFGDSSAAAPPATWVGYSVIPERLTFWSAARGAASRRLAYRRQGAAWIPTHLPG